MADFAADKVLSRYFAIFKQRYLKTLEALYAELNERAVAATSSYSATGNFLQYIYFVLMAKNNQQIRSWCLVHEFSFTDII